MSLGLIPMQRIIDKIPLRHGSHRTRDDGMCAMEMVAWLAGEAHSDEPACACPVLAALMRASNDLMSDRQRDALLRPLVPMLVNSRRAAAAEAARGWRAVDHLLRHLSPVLLRQRGDAAGAEVLAEITPIRTVVAAQAARLALSTCAHQPRAVAWVLDRAIDGLPPRQYVAAVAQVAGSIGGDQAWASVAQLVRTALAVTAPEAALASER